MTKKLEPSRALATAFAHAKRFRSNTATRPPRAMASAEMLELAFGQPTPEKGEDAAGVIDQLAAAAEPGLMGMTGPRFFGWVIGASHEAGVAADWLASAWGQNAGNFYASPAAAMAEKAASRWLLDILNLPQECSVGFVTGATMANFTCLAAARSEVLCRVGWNVEADGLMGAPAITVFIGADAHATVLNALQYLGLGRKRVVTIDTDDQGRMRPEVLDQHLQATVGPKIVVAQAGQINTGAIDPMTEIVRICRCAGAWLHVDGAFGLWANTSPLLRHLTVGVEGADSWATDGHKWLQLPYETGFAIVRHPAAHRRAMNINASYLPETKGAQYEASQFVPELSRRARGFATWALLKTLGRQGIEDMVVRHCGFARHLAEKLQGEAGIRIENEVGLNQVILSFGDGDADQKQRDLLTKAVILEIQSRNRVFVEGGDWRGDWVLRVSIISEPTQQSDIEMLADEIVRAWRTISKTQSMLALPPR